MLLWKFGSTGKENDEVGELVSVGWSDHHGGVLERVVVPMPEAPVDAVGVAIMVTLILVAVEVGVVTLVVPPATLVSVPRTKATSVHLNVGPTDTQR